MTFKTKLDFVGVKKFVNIAQDLSVAVTLYSGKYVVDGKSILGIFSLDLSKPVTVEIDGNDDYTELFKEFLA